MTTFASESSTDWYGMPTSTLTCQSGRSEVLESVGMGGYYPGMATHTLPDGVAFVTSSTRAYVPLVAVASDDAWLNLIRSGVLSGPARPGDVVEAEGTRWLVEDTHYSVITLRSEDSKPPKRTACEWCGGTGERQVAHPTPLWDGKRFCPSCGGQGFVKDWTDV